MTSSGPIEVKDDVMKLKIAFPSEIFPAPPTFKGKALGTRLTFQFQPCFECHISPGPFSEVSRVVAAGKPNSQETVKQPPGEMEEEKARTHSFPVQTWVV